PVRPARCGPPSRSPSPPPPPAPTGSWPISCTSPATSSWGSSSCSCSGCTRPRRCCSGRRPGISHWNRRRTWKTEGMPETSAVAARPKVLWLARLEYRYHAWRERRARARGLTPTVAAFPGYGSADWVRVVGRVLIVPPRRRGGDEFAGVRGWRSFVGIPIGFAQVSITVDGQTHEVVSDRGGVVDTVIPARLEPGWRTLQMSVEGGEPVDARVFIVGADVRFGAVSDVDDTVMVTALPRPLVAAWNSFVVDEHARQPVPGMAVLLERL